MRIRMLVMAVVCAEQFEGAVGSICNLHVRFYLQLLYFNNIRQYSFSCLTTCMYANETCDSVHMNGLIVLQRDHCTVMN